MIPMDPQDARINLQVRAILNSRYVDTSKVDYFTIKGTVYLRGPMKQLRGGRTVVMSEIDNIVENVSRITGVKDVINEMTLIELKKISEAAVREEAE
ncbi:MAG: hypothetical protein WC074_04815 [bacterium]|jgi:osmotically-inducible protein OsmY